MQKQSRNNNDEDYCMTEPFMLIAKPIGVDYTVNINEAFSHPKQFEYIVHALTNAGEDDYFTLNLTTPGGAIHSVLPLLGAIHDTQAHVHVHVASNVASAGTFLLMAAHSISLNDDVEIMFHQAKFGAWGNMWEVEKQVEYTLRSIKKLMKKYYKYFLTDTEVSTMLTGTEFYMDKEEFIERYQKRAELINLDIDAIVAEIEAEEAAKAKPAKKRKPLGKVSKPVDVNEEL